MVTSILEAELQPAPHRQTEVWSMEDRLSITFQVKVQLITISRLVTDIELLEKLDMDSVGHPFYLYMA